MVQARKFEEDLVASNNPELRKDWERIFRLKFGAECSVEWKDAVEIQKEFGTDITISTKEGRRYSVELKTRRYGCFEKDLWIMEIVHHIYNREEEPRTHQYSKEGWVYNTTAEYIFHAGLDKTGTKIKEVIFYAIAPFKSEEYKGEFDKYMNLWLTTKYPDGKFQLTLNKKIPKEIIKRDTLEFWEWEDEN